MEHTSAEHDHLLDQVRQIAGALGETFAPFCEVVVHDLLDPAQAVVAIHNNLSGRQAGDPATELGLARISDPDYPAVVANYANRFPDGRQAKSTSIGIKDAQGRYVAALCLNVDLTLFQSFQSAVAQFVSTDEGKGAQESLDPPGAGQIRAHMDQFAARLATSPRALKADERRALLKSLRDAGLLDVRRAMEIIAAHLGVSRASVYGYAK